VIAVAHGMGFAVPEDLSVAGFDDIPLTQQVWPALTTIKQPIQMMAAQAAQLLIAQLRGAPQDQTEHILESTLTFRQSTGPARNRDFAERARSRAHKVESAIA